MDGVLLLLLFALIWIAVAFGLGPLISRTLTHKPPQDREQLGLLERQRAESRARVERALHRYYERKSA